MSLKCIQHQHPPFSKKHPLGRLFRIAVKRIFTNSLVTQPSGLHLTIILLSRCSFSTVSQFRNMYGGNMLPSATTTNIKVTYTFFYHALFSLLHNFYPNIIDSNIWWHIQVHLHFIGTSYLAQDVIIHLSNSNHMLFKSNKVPLEVCWQFLAKFFYDKRTCSPVSHVRTKPCCSYLTTCDVWLGKFPCFKIYCLTHTWHYSFSLHKHKLSKSLRKLLDMLMLVSTERFSDRVHIYQLPQPWTFLLRCKFSFFSACLITVTLNMAAQLCLIPIGTQLPLAAICSTWPFYWNNKELTICMDLN